MDDLKTIVASHDIECLGCNSDRDDVFEEGGEDVVVLVFKDGMTKPLCKYYQENINHCTALGNKPDERKNWGICPYYSKPRSEL